MFNFAKPKVNQIYPQKLYDAIEKKEDFILLDVRTEQEFEKGKIAGSINIPVDKIEKNIEKIISDKNKTVYVYCLSGSRSVAAADLMTRLGYKNVFELKNGLLAWRVGNFPVV